MDELTTTAKRTLMLLKRCRSALTAQQYRTLKGQVLAGDTLGALNGLEKIMKGKATT